MVCVRNMLYRARKGLGVGVKSLSWSTASLKWPARWPHAATTRHLTWGRGSVFCERAVRARGFRNKNVDTKRESLSNPGMKEPTHIIIQNSMPAHSGMAVKHPVHGRLILVKRAGGDAWHCRKRDDTSGNLTILRPKDWKPDFGE